MKTCTGKGQIFSQQSASTSDLGGKIKQEIKEENEAEMNPLEFVKSELCEDYIDSTELYLQSGLEDTIKLEIKEEREETEDFQEPIFTEDVTKQLLENLL